MLLILFSFSWHVCVVNGSVRKHFGSIDFNVFLLLIWLCTTKIIMPICFFLFPYLIIIVCNNFSNIIMIIIVI